jgi:spore coat protein U-like protein
MRIERSVRAVAVFGLLYGFWLLATPVQASQSSATFNLSVSVTITNAIGINKTSDLDFGSVVTDADGPGTVLLTATGSRSASPNLSFGRGIPVNATFAVTKPGGGSNRFSVSLPTAVTITNGLSTMTVDNFVHNAMTTPPYSSAPYTLTVGARLNVTGNQEPGTYYGTFTVTVDQQ